MLSFKWKYQFEVPGNQISGLVKMSVCMYVVIVL